MAYDPAAIHEAEKGFWGELWDAAVDDAVDDLGIDMERFGPVQAAVVTEEPQDAALNFILGAASEGAVEQGHLVKAVEWVESHGVDYRAPTMPGLPDAGAADDWFKRHGYTRERGPGKLARDASPPQFEMPPGIEVYDRTDPLEDEGFGDPLAESLGLPYWAATFFLDLPGREDWRCYCAAEGDEPLAYAVMLICPGVAELALASRPRARGEGEGQIAVLRHCIAEAAASNCDTLVVAETGREPPVADRNSLIRAGFDVACQCSTWRPPVRVTT